MKKKNKIIAIAIVVIILIAIIAMVSIRGKKLITPHQTTLVVLSTVKTANVPITLHTTANLLPYRQADISPETAGYVKAINYNEGTFVTAGRVLIQLDARQQEDKVQQAQAQAANSETSYKRNKRLGSSQYIAAQDLDKLKSQALEDQAALASAKTTLDEMTLRAPFDGYMGEKIVSIGDYLQAGQKVATLTDTTKLKINYTVPAFYSDRIQLGQVVSVNGPDNKKLYGKVSYISPTIDQNSQTLTVHATLSNQQDYLKPGQYVSLSQQLGKAKQAILIPENALLGSMDGYYVLQVNANKVTSQTVTPGAHYNGMVIIRNGLKATSEIITAGQNQVKIGDTVRVAASETSP